MRKLFLISVLLMVLLTSCGANYCSKRNVQTYLDAVVPLFTQWNDQLIVANSTGRISLSGPISNLQTTKREFLAIEHPVCLNSAHNSVSKGMNAVIDGFVAFMSNNEINLASTQIKAGSNDIDTGIDSMIAIKKCAPHCE